MSPPSLLDIPPSLCTGSILRHLARDSRIFRRSHSTMSGVSFAQAQLRRGSQMLGSIAFAPLAPAQAQCLPVTTSPEQVAQSPHLLTQARFRQEAASPNANGQRKHTSGALHRLNSCQLRCRRDVKHPSSFCTGSHNQSISCFTAVSSTN